MNPLLRRAAAHVVVESLEAPVLDPDDEHHLGRVLRIRPDDPLTVTDGRGRWAPARWSAAGGLVLAGETADEPAPTPVSVVAAIPKGERPEWMVQKLTELGVDRIGFVETSRSVVRWDPAKVERQLIRLRKVAREASMQSRRVHLPLVEVLSWADVVAGARSGSTAVAEPGADLLDERVRTVVVGPEGGFTDDELAAVPVHVGLGEQVLRVETAALVAAVHLRLAHGQ